MENATLNDKPGSADSSGQMQPLTTNNRSRWIYFLLIAAIGTVADLWSKSAVFDWLSNKPGYSYEVIDGIFRFVLAENAGAAFGIAQGQRVFLTIVSMAALVGILGMVYFQKQYPKLVYISLGMLTGGVCGNLYDRLFNDGRVRDFIDIVYWPGKHWPAFNIADSLLCVAVVLLIAASWNSTSAKPDPQHPPQQKEAS